MSLFQTLKPKPKSHDTSCCLLLDISGSMSERISSGNIYDPAREDGLDPRRIDQMFKVVRETPECNGLTSFVFSTHCQILARIPQADEHLSCEYSTDLANAFLTVKAAGYYSAILVTDGCPNSEQAAINAAIGMKLGIIYIGNPPVPEFLARLAKATDGTFEIADMRAVDQLQIALQRALPAPETDETDSKLKGTITL